MTGKPSARNFNLTPSTFCASNIREGALFEGNALFAALKAKRLIGVKRDFHRGCYGGDRADDFQLRERIRKGFPRGGGAAYVRMVLCIGDGDGIVPKSVFDVCVGTFDRTPLEIKGYLWRRFLYQQDDGAISRGDGDAILGQTLSKGDEALGVGRAHFVSLSPRTRPDGGTVCGAFVEQDVLSDCCPDTAPKKYRWRRLDGWCIRDAVVGMADEV